MTLQELYGNIGESYEHALRVLRVEKLVDKHIRKYPKNGVVDAVLEAGKTMDPTQLFEAAHAVKGISANLGLTGLSDLAAELTEEFRPGNARRHSDAEIAEILRKMESLYRKTAQEIQKYEEG